ncbi:4-trimethylaminobutyraldehyde dehydrogenase-like [Tubulanus polymorphus]|uniref:4-trimethylaminobutyraldehyde dehydrogenase-like n=1 Tax=Tubulanus polymorphus TaxID=672921 RepID=UPI003DA5A0E5
MSSNLLRRLSSSGVAGLTSRLAPACRACYSSVHTANQNYVNGEIVGTINSDRSQDFEVHNPATGELICKLASAGPADVDGAVHAAKQAFKEWSSMTGMDRGKILREAARRIRSESDKLAHVEVMDTGKALWEAEFDIAGCADSIDYYGCLATTVSGQFIPLANGSHGYTIREPLGVCGGIGAWNYPFQMASWKSAPALACGNTLVFKPSQFTPLTAVMLAEIYTQSGVPNGVFNVIQGQGETGQLLCKHADIAKMSFTGSVETGSKVMATCAEGIKKVTLELGGKSPMIVFEDADLENAAKGAIMANFLTQGQVCSNGTRVFVHRSILEPFLEKVVARTKLMTHGDPLHKDTKVGAMIHEQQAQKVLDYIQSAVDEGAEILYGGDRVDMGEKFAKGHFLRPCILVNCRDDMKAVREEIFGSVMTVLPFDAEDEVLQRANNTELGLAGGVFTNDLNRAHRVAAALQAGSLYVNNYNVYPPEMPFGGNKKSGIGREGGQVALDYYTQVKSVYVESGDVWCPV